MQVRLAMGGLIKYICETTMGTIRSDKRDISQRGHHTRDWAVWDDWCPALRRRGVLVAGYTSLGVGYQILRRSLDFPHVGACVEGEVDYFASGHWQRAQTGMVLVAPAG